MKPRISTQVPGVCLSTNFSARRNCPTAGDASHENFTTHINIFQFWQESQEAESHVNLKLDMFHCDDLAFSVFPHPSTRKQQRPVHSIAARAEEMKRKLLL